MASHEWSKKYTVLFISRLYLQEIGLTIEQINTLSNLDMQAIADDLANEFIANGFGLHLQFAVTAALEKKGTTNARKNPCAKTVTPETAYEVWQVEDHPGYGGKWTWYVLKKYQSPQRETSNLAARWLCYVTSPYVPNGEYGDTYVTDITSIAHKLDHNPLTCTDEKTTGKEKRA